MSVYTAVQAADVLTTEGRDLDDVLAVITSMITNTALELVQPDDGYVFTADELDVLRRQLDESAWTMCEGGCGRALPVDEAEHAQCRSLLIYCSDCLADHARTCLVCGAE